MRTQLTDRCWSVMLAKPICAAVTAVTFSALTLSYASFAGADWGSRGARDRPQKSVPRLAGTREPRRPDAEQAAGYDRPPNEPKPPRDNGTIAVVASAAPLTDSSVERAGNLRPPDASTPPPSDKSNLAPLLGFLASFLGALAGVLTGGWRKRRNGKKISDGASAAPPRDEPRRQPISTDGASLNERPREIEMSRASPAATLTPAPSLFPSAGANSIPAPQLFSEVRERSPADPSPTKRSDDAQLNPPLTRKAEPPPLVPSVVSALPEVEVFAIGKRGETVLGDDVLLVNHDLQRGWTLFVVADGSTHGEESITARRLAATVASACLDALRRYLVDRPAGDTLQGSLEQRIPAYLQDHLGGTTTAFRQDEGGVLRSCAFVAGIATPTRVIAVGSGDCVAFGRAKGTTQIVQRPDSNRNEGIGASGTGVSAIARNGLVEFVVTPLFAFEIDNPRAVYICSDGAYYAWLEEYKETGPRAVDEMDWSDIVANLVKGQEPGTYRNDDVTAIRLRYR